MQVFEVNTPLPEKAIERAHVSYQRDGDTIRVKSYMYNPRTKWFAVMLSYRGKISEANGKNILTGRFLPGVTVVVISVLLGIFFIRPIVAGIIQQRRLCYDGRRIYRSGLGGNRSLCWAIGLP